MHHCIEFDNDEEEGDNYDDDDDDGEGDDDEDNPCGPSGGARLICRSISDNDEGFRRMIDGDAHCSVTQSILLFSCLMLSC